MARTTSILAASLFGAAVLLAQPAAAQDYATTTVSKTRIWAGGGVQFLSLPEIQFTAQGGRKQDNTEKDFWDAGGSVGGGFETSLGHLGSSEVFGSIKGFWSQVETDRFVRCSGNANCTVIDPTGANTFVSSSLSTKADREADYWGAQAELKFTTGAPSEIKPDIYRNDYFIVGFDVRGIDQDRKLRSTTGTLFTLNETLDTTYTGGYVGIGGEYSFGFIPFVGRALKGVDGIYDRLGLRTYLNATAGIYNAETDYTGRFTGPATTQLKRSSDEVAFIGAVSLETRKQLGVRSSVSLWTDYEYISSVPQMRYDNGTGRPARIDDDSVFATRTMLRLNIGLGSRQLYATPVYDTAPIK